MKTPSEFELSQLSHLYDPRKAHEYYLRTRKLKGRKKGQGDDQSSGPFRSGPAPRKGKTRKQISKGARAKQRKELAAAIKNLESKLQKLEALIKKKTQEEASEDRKGKAKKERAAKEKDKPKTAAEKAEAARENKKYREKNQQKLKSEAKKDSGNSDGGGSSSDSGGGSSSKTNKAPEASVSDLKSLATRVRGQIAVAKQKLAAL